MPPMDAPMGYPPQNTGGMQMDSNGGLLDQLEDNANQNNGESEFDTGFDAGVEADEDEDPKKFIQQLTGKLSQSLNTYNNENGDDEELSKYVGKMIVKAAAKGLDDSGKKDLIKTINTTEGSDEEGLDDVDMNNGADEGGEEIEQPSQQPPQEEPMEIQECVFSKSELKKLLENVGKKQEKPKVKDSPFNPKLFNK